MLRLVASGRAVSATPDWLVRETPGVRAVQLGEGIAKSIHLGIRKGARPDYLSGLVDLARTVKA